MGSEEWSVTGETSSNEISCGKQRQIIHQVWFAVSTINHSGHLKCLMEMDLFTRCQDTKTQINHVVITLSSFTHCQFSWREHTNTPCVCSLRQSSQKNNIRICNHNHLTNFVVEQEWHRQPWIESYAITKCDQNNVTDKHTYLDTMYLCNFVQSASVTDFSCSDSYCAIKPLSCVIGKPFAWISNIYHLLVYCYKKSVCAYCESNDIHVMQCLSWTWRFAKWILVVLNMTIQY